MFDDNPDPGCTCSPSRVLNSTHLSRGIDPSDRGVLRWDIDSDLPTTSEHEVIIFAWAQLRATAATKEMITTPNWNINRLYADKQAMEGAAERWRALSEGRLLVDPHAASEEELEAEAFWIQNSLKIVLDTHSTRKCSLRSLEAMVDSRDQRDETVLRGRKACVQVRPSQL